ncbi:MAG: mechanosensitive ion channel domain-containing protein [Woeseiaceae bacterium]
MTTAVCLFALMPAFGQTADEPTVTGLTATALQSQIDQLADSSAYDAATRSAALENYRRALANVATADGHNNAAERYRQSITEAPAEAERLRASVAERRAADPLDGLAVSPDSTIAAIDELLQREQVSEASARATITELRQQLAAAENRPQAARERLTLANDELRAITGTLSQPDSTAEPEIIQKARRAARQSAVVALRAEIQMLDQEVLSQPVRIVLLQTQTDDAARILEHQQARVRALQTTLSERRREDTERVLAEFGLESLGAEVLHPIVEKVIRERRALAEELDRLTLTNETLTQSNDVAEGQLEEMRQRYARARGRLSAVGVGQALGRWLAQERRELPIASDYRREQKLRENQVAEASVRNIGLGERWRAIRDVESYVDEQLALIPGDEAMLLRPTLTQLVESQSGVLRQLMRSYGRYLRLLADSGYTQSQLFDLSSEYRVFVAEHLMWVRSRGAFGWADLVALPGELMAFFSPGRWVDAASIFSGRLLRSPLQIAAVLVLLLFYWKRTSLHARLRDTTAKVNKPSEDSFGSTIIAVLLTALMTLPWPIFVAATGYEIASEPRADEASHAIGVALYQVSLTLLALLGIRMLCTSGGVAVGHFRWAPEGVATLRRQFDWLTPALVLPAFVLLVNREFDDSAVTSGLNQIMLLILAGSLTLFLYRLLRRSGGMAEGLRRRPGSRSVIPYPRFFFLAATLIPLAVGVMSWAGFMYSAGTLLRKLFYSILLFFAVVIVRELIVRWLLVIRRRLLLREALQRREAAAREASGEAVPSDESSEAAESAIEDIASLDADTRKLVNVALVIATIVGIAGIWSSVLPALGIFRDITLWHYVATVGGEDMLRSVTLTDLFVAGIIIVVTIVSARNIPALIEIVMRQRPSIKPGSRLAFATLARYTIAIIGIVATLSIVGVNWSKLQWLVAGLTVGIGFGLRDIIASFISGLIILIERPIRVGDMVSVGEISGTVSRIQIRATTVRTLDQQELLVPNMEFIATPVLNWTLSDEVVCIHVTVGIAYGSDVEKALRLLETVALEHPDVIADPEPLVTFEAFGDSSLTLGLRCYIQDLEIRLKTRTDLHRAINRKFEEAGIVIAFSQRDLHLDTASPLDVRILPGASPKP